MFLNNIIIYDKRGLIDMILNEFHFLSVEEIEKIVHYIIVFTCIFVCCFLGSVIRDAIYASKNKSKIDIKTIFLYDVPCASVIAALGDILSNKIHISGWAFISLFLGIWSREFVSILLNSKMVSFILKFMFGRAINNAQNSLTDEEKEALTNTFKNAVNTAMIEDKSSKDNKSNDYDEPVGEFEWIDILEQ